MNVQAEQAKFAFMQEFQQRRMRLLAALPEGSIVILFGEKTRFRNHDSEYPFRQNSDFYYLSGFSEPDAVLVLIKSQQPEKKADQFILFCHQASPDEEIWTGKRASLSEILVEYGATLAYDRQDLDKIMPNLMSNKSCCYYTLGQEKNHDDQVFSWVNIVRAKARKGEDYPKSWHDLASIIHELRVIKSSYEIELMKQAAEISVAGHIRLMKYCRPGITEYQLEGEFLHECLHQGARFMAYPSIVGAGHNACVLHYTANTDVLNAGTMVLIDAGCEYNYYASDITRSYPINGRFTKEQQAIYELVLKAQMAAIEIVRPGTTWDALQTIIVQILVHGLVNLNILRGAPEKLIEEKAYLPFYMHSSGHWLGLDVHDAGAYKINGEWRVLKPGMVLTVEPGLYIRQSGTVDKKWWGLGVRIEDDVLVTEQGHEVLTEKLPKTVQQIEAIMAHVQ